MPAKHHNNARINALRIAIAKTIDPLLEADWTAEEFTVAFLQLSAASIMAMNGESDDKFRWGLKRFTEFCQFYAADLVVDLHTYKVAKSAGVVN